MTTTRRDLFKFVGGSAVGALFTPVPWRLITDTALWSENWPGIPVPARGEIRTRFTNCSLCTAGCAVRVRSIGDQPVALAPVAGPSREPRRHVPVRIDGTPSALSSRAGEARAGEGSSGGRGGCHRPRRTGSGAGPAAGPHGVVDLSPGHGGDPQWRCISLRRSRWARARPSNLAKAQDGAELRRAAARWLGHARKRDRATRRISVNPGGGRGIAHGVAGGPVDLHQSRHGDWRWPWGSRAPWAAAGGLFHSESGGGHGAKRTTGGATGPRTGGQRPRAGAGRRGIFGRSGAQHAPGRARPNAGHPARSSGARGLEEGRAGDGTGRYPRALRAGAADR